MFRKILTVALPLLLPFLLYGIYLSLARRRAQLAGAEHLPRWQQAPWIWIAFSGVLLMGASLLAFELTRGVKPGTELEPPRMIDGEIVPSHPVDE